MKKYAVFVGLAALNLLFLDSTITFAAGGAAQAGTLSPGQPTQQIIGDWVVACEPRANGHKSCAMMQTLASAKLKRPVGVLAIGKDATGKLRASIRLPVGVSLPDGVAVGIDDRVAFMVSYSACHQIGCFAPFDVDEPLLGKLRKASKISAVAQSVSKQALNLNFSTNGFPAAYDVYVKESR